MLARATPDAFQVSLGDTSKGETKSARLEAGVAVRMLLFVARGDIIRVDTRNGEYVSRVR